MWKFWSVMKKEHEEPRKIRRNKKIKGLHLTSCNCTPIFSWPIAASSRDVDVVNQTCLPSVYVHFRESQWGVCSAFLLTFYVKAASWTAKCFNVRRIGFLTCCGNRKRLILWSSWGELKPVMFSNWADRLVFAYNLTKYMTSEVFKLIFISNL